MDKEQTLIYGIRSVKEAIESEKSLNRVYIQRGLKEALEIENELLNSSPDEVLKKIGMKIGRCVV